MKRLLLMLGLVMVVIATLGVSPSDAQSPPPDFSLYMTARVGLSADCSQLYQLNNGTFTRVSEEAICGSTLSPDGAWLVFLSPAPFFETTAARYDYLLGSARDITLLNLTDGTRRVVAVQPDDITIDVSAGVLRNAITRTVPEWSRDGSAIVWTEQHYPDGDVRRLMMYDLATETTTVLDPALPAVGSSVDGLPYDFEWGNGGIAVAVSEGDDQNQPALRLYTPTDGLTMTILLPSEPSNWGFGVRVQWVLDADADTPTEWVLAQDLSGYVYGVEPTTGDLIFPVVPTQFATSASNPATSLQVVWDFRIRSDITWQLLSSDGEVLLTEAIQPTLPLLSPSGTQIAYREGRTVYVGPPDALETIVLPDDMNRIHLMWGALQWWGYPRAFLNPDGTMG